MLLLDSMEEASALATNVGILAKRMLGMSASLPLTHQGFNLPCSYWDPRIPIRPLCNL
jgi:hypothetical protein